MPQKLVVKDIRGGRVGEIVIDGKCEGEVYTALGRLLGRFGIEHEVKRSEVFLKEDHLPASTGPLSQKKKK